jgi:hypothetical protein
VKPDEGIHITGTRMTDPSDGSISLLRIDVWPLPNDIAIHTELMEFARSAIHARLTERGLTGAQWCDVHRKQRDQ